MSPSTLVAMLVVLMASASVSLANMGESQKPNMPHVFQNEKQLSQYLQALDDYYLLLGKPRFGRSFQDSNELKRWNSPYAEYLRTV
ncbi:pro-neuropeptide Y-like isoform X1 [Amblyomma americanum]